MPRTHRHVGRRGQSLAGAHALREDRAHPTGATAVGMGIGARGHHDAEHVRARRDPMLTFLGESAAAELGRSPWTNVYGLGRSLLAAGTLATLAASPSETLFRPAAG